MHSETTWIDVINAAAGIATALAFVVAAFVAGLNFRQFRQSRSSFAEQIQLSRRQAQASDEAAKVQSAFILVNMLEADENLQARFVINQLELSNKPFAQWTEAELAAAERTWRVFSVASVFQQMNAIPADFMAEYYGPTVVRLWKVLSPMIVAKRARGGARTAGMLEDLAKHIETTAPRYKLVHASDTVTDQQLAQVP